MSGQNKVLVIGLIPELVDLGGFPGLTPEKVRLGIEGQVARLRELGYDAASCWIDLGETAEAVVAAALEAAPYACVAIGAGIRVVPAHFLLFERLINVVHKKAPKAAICFNTQPHDTCEAVQRWLSA